MSRQQYYSSLRHAGDVSPLSVGIFLSTSPPGSTLGECLSRLRQVKAGRGHQREHVALLVDRGPESRHSLCINTCRTVESSVGCGLKRGNISLLPVVQGSRLAQIPQGETMTYRERLLQGRWRPGLLSVLWLATRLSFQDWNFSLTMPVSRDCWRSGVDLWNDNNNQTD